MKLNVTLLLFLCACTPVKAEDVPLFAVASNMMQVMTEILKQYRHEPEAGNINLIFGSSGNFARQIIQGAPFELFLSANKKYVDVLRQHNGHVTSFHESPNSITHSRNKGLS